MKKNLVKISENSFKQIVAESVKKVLIENEEEFIGDEFQEEPIYGIGTVIYDINSDEIRDYEDDGGDDFKSIPEAISTIKYMCTYPKNSAEWDIRYANDFIPAFYIYDKNLKERIDNKLYLSSIDAKYKQRFDSNGAEEVVIVNAKNLSEAQLRQIVAESVKKVLKENGEGIEMMGSAPSEGYGKYGKLMEKLDEVGDIEIARILHDCEKRGMDKDLLIHINGILSAFKGTLIHSLDTRYW